MAKGSWTGTDSSAVIVAADSYREYLTIQLTNATQTNLGIGVAAVADEGIQLINAGDTVRIEGAQAQLAIYAIGNGAAGTYQDGKVYYYPGPQVAS
jgi:hypothetical protein